MWPNHYWLWRRVRGTCNIKRCLTQKGCNTRGYIELHVGQSSTSDERSEADGASHAARQMRSSDMSVTISARFAKFLTTRFLFLCPCAGAYQVGGSHTCIKSSGTCVEVASPLVCGLNGQ